MNWHYFCSGFYFGLMFGICLDGFVNWLLTGF